MKNSSTGIKNFKKGEVIQGVVNNITPNSVFVKINDKQTGVLYKEEVSDIRLRTPADKLKVGEKINVVVKKYNNDTGKIILSLKALCNNDIDYKEIHENDILSGVVRNQYKNGVFVEIKPNLVGLADKKLWVSYGDTVNVIVKKVSQDTQKIKLEILD